MFQRFKTARRNREIVDQVFGSLVEESRRTALYTECEIPDTVMGRFEALSIHLILFLRRCRGDDGLKPVAQDLIDRFITEIEASIRELGVGDPSVPKRMRKLAGIFYERAAAYDGALDGDEPLPALAAAVKGRAIAADAADVPAQLLAAYIVDTIERYRKVGAEEILSGRFLPSPADRIG